MAFADPASMLIARLPKRWAASHHRKSGTSMARTSRSAARGAAVAVAAAFGYPGAMRVVAVAVTELRRSPLATTSAVVGTIVATLSLLVAWWDRVDPPPAVVSVRVPTVADLDPGRLALNVAFLLAATLSTACAARLLARRHPFPAFVASIALATLSLLGSMALLRLAPPRTMSPRAMTAAQDVAFWATVLAHVALNGSWVARILADFARTSEREKEGAGGDGVVFLFLLAATLWTWGAMVAAGERMVTDALLA